MFTKNKNKIYIIIIIGMIIVIGLTQYKLKTEEKLKTASATENNSHANISSNNNDLFLPDIKDLPILKVPTKKQGYKDPIINAYNYILLDKKTNYVLAEENGYKQVPIASTTKIMTAILAFENYNMDDTIEISKKAASQIGSDVNLRYGEKLTVRNVMYALLIMSGNDAAMALAEHYKNGGEAGFVAKMNEKAKYLGLKNTSFKDSAGLDDSGYSTAYDLAVLTSYALRIDEFNKIIKTPSYEIKSLDGKLTHDLDNSNRLIDGEEPLYYPFAIGVKTGFTPDAGHCLVSAASKDDNTLIGVVLNTHANKNDSSARESRKLLEWGFDNYEF